MPAVEAPPDGDRVVLADEAGRPLAVLEVEEVFEYDKQREAEHCFRTTDDAHGVARLFAQHRCTSPDASPSSTGPSRPIPELAMDPAETRAAFTERGWRRVVGFQTRNPIHRAHEYLTKVALETVDGLLIHPLVGDTKSDDVPAATRVECYRVLLDGYYPAERVVIAFPAAMRYAGPREAIWHAICRKNYGCSHFIVGRDHAGVGDYYGTYDAQLIFDEFEPHELGIEPMFFEHAFWCKACGSMATPKTCPHEGDDHVFLSGTKVRELLNRRAAAGRVLAARGRGSADRRVQVSELAALGHGPADRSAGRADRHGRRLADDADPHPRSGSSRRWPSGRTSCTAPSSRPSAPSATAARNGLCRITFWMFLASAPMSLLGEGGGLARAALRRRRRVGDGEVIGAALILGGLGFLAKTFVKQGVQPSDAPFLLADRDRVICIVWVGPAASSWA